MFSDSDLKRLKEMLTEVEGYPQAHADVILNFVRFRFEALLARLEAAEKVCESCTRLNESDFEKAYQTWLKACGR